MKLAVEICRGIAATAIFGVFPKLGFRQPAVGIMHEFPSMGILKIHENLFNSPAK